MLHINYDRLYNQQRNEELAIFTKCRFLEERLRLWKGVALWTMALLFVVICFVVTFGVA